MTPRPEVRGATIAGTGMYVPEARLTNQDFERMVDTSDEWIRERTGIIERRIAAPEQASSDMALEAGKRALDMAGLQPTDIDQIILATTSPDRYLPSCACTVQHKLGATNAAAPLLGVNGVCFIGHGSSTPRAIRSAIRTVLTFVEKRVNEHIRDEIEADRDTAA